MLEIMPDIIKRCLIDGGIFLREIRYVNKLKDLTAILAPLPLTLRMEKTPPQVGIILVGPGA